MGFTPDHLGHINITYGTQSCPTNGTKTSLDCIHMISCQGEPLSCRQT